ncbi:hypothetical protein Peur_073876 [Populus x canadensis]
MVAGFWVCVSFSSINAFLIRLQFLSFARFYFKRQEPRFMIMFGVFWINISLILPFLFLVGFSAA